MIRIEVLNCLFELVEKQRIPLRGTETSNAAHHAIKSTMGQVEKQRIPFGGLKPSAVSRNPMLSTCVEKQRIPFGGLKPLADALLTGIPSLVEKQRIPFGGLKRVFGTWKCAFLPPGRKTTNPLRGTETNRTSLRCRKRRR